MLSLLGLMQGLFFSFLFLLGSQSNAKSISLSTRDAWIIGTLDHLECDSSFGRLLLVADNEVPQDSFDQSFLKTFWTPSIYSVVNPMRGYLDIQAVGVTDNLGVRSNFLPISSNGSFLVNIKPVGQNQSGSIVLSGLPWSKNYVNVTLTWTSNQSQLRFISNTEGVTRSATLVKQINYLSDFDVKITKQGNTLNAYYSLTPNTWTLVSSTVMALSPANYSVGLGAINPDYAGLAEYRNFQVLPYSATGTWTSAAIDLGGKPLKAGRVDWVANVPLGTGLQLQCASSDDKSNWSAFSGDLNNGGSFSAPLARYVKFRVNLQASVARDLSPELDKITLTQDDLESDLLKGENVKFVPNPARGDKVTLLYGLGQKPQKVTLEVYSPAGRQLWQKDVSAGLGQNSFDLDASGMASGSYFMRVLAWSQEGGQPVIITKPFALLR